MSQLDPSRIRRDELLPPAHPESRYHLSMHSKEFSDLHVWATERSEDPAFKVSARVLRSKKWPDTEVQKFIPRLKNHLLRRIQGKAYEGNEHEFLPEDRHNVHFTRNRIYHHKTICFNYTTYNLRHD